MTGAAVFPPEVSALLAPAQELHIIHQDPMLLIADENDQRRRLFTDFPRGQRFRQRRGLQQRLSVTRLGRYRADGGNDDAGQEN